MNMINILKYLLPVIIFTAPCMGYAAYVYSCPKLDQASCEIACKDTFGATDAYAIPCPPDGIPGAYDLPRTGFCCVDGEAKDILDNCYCHGEAYITKHDTMSYPVAYEATECMSSLGLTICELKCDSGDKVCFCNRFSYGPGLAVWETSMGTNCRYCPSITLINPQTNQATVLQGATRTHESAAGGALSDTSITDCFVGSTAPAELRTKYKDTYGTFTYTGLCKYVKNGSGQ